MEVDDRNKTRNRVNCRRTGWVHERGSSRERAAGQRISAHSTQTECQSRDSDADGEAVLEYRWLAKPVLQTYR
jgi:hypothetical protein